MDNTLLNVLDFANEIDITSMLLDKAKLADDIVIFGAGIGGKATIDILNNNSLGHKVRFFCDNNLNKVGKPYCDRNVIRLMKSKKKQAQKG